MSKARYQRQRDGSWHTVELGNRLVRWWRGQPSARTVEREAAMGMHKWLTYPVDDWMAGLREKFEREWKAKP